MSRPCTNNPDYQTSYTTNIQPPEHYYSTTNNPNGTPQKHTVRFQSHPRESLLPSTTTTTTSSNSISNSSSSNDPCACADNYVRHASGIHGEGRDLDVAMLFSYRTQYRSQYGRTSGIPYTRRHPPREHEPRSDQVSWKARKYDAPIQSFRCGEGTHGNDPDRGWYEWRGLIPRPGEYVWNPLERNLFWRNTGKYKSLPDARIIQHNSMHQKEKWVQLKKLDAADCMSYRYRKHLPGYEGHVNSAVHVDAHVSRDAGMDNNPAMESTVQASYREHPADLYLKGPGDQANMHKGPLSRMVTLTHPFNPFTQQSAYCNMGATDTTSSCVP